VAELIIEDGRRDVKAAETLLREYMRGHLDEVGGRFGVQTTVSDALAEDLAALRDPDRQDRGLLVAWHDGTPAGCVALVAGADDTVRLGRLYVRPAYRRAGIGRRLAEAALLAAQMGAAAAVRLDAHDGAVPALALFESLGFAPIPPDPAAAVAEDLHPQWVFMELALAAA